MTCNKCGNNVPDNAGFCPYCGTQFDSAAAPQSEYAYSAYQPGGSDQYYAPPAQEMQHQYEFPAEYTAPAPEKPEPPKNKKSVVSILFTVVAIILVVGLAGLNVFQYLRAEDTAGELAVANKQIGKMEKEAGDLKDEITALDEELAQLKADYDFVADQADGIEEIVADYEDQISVLESENRILAASVEDYEAKLGTSGEAIEFYDRIIGFIESEQANGYRAHSHFYAGTNLVVVKVGQTAVIDIIYTEHGGDAKTIVEWASWYINADFGDYTDNVLPLSITGLNPGVTNIVLSNSMDDAAFEIMVVIVE